MTQTRQPRGVEAVKEDIVGQGGTIVPVNEVRYTPDQAILDPNSPLAVQIPEGVGADGSRVDLQLGNVLAEGHVEAKFGTAAAPTPASSDAGDVAQAPEHTPDTTLIVTPNVSNVPEVVRTADPVRDVADSDPTPVAAPEDDKKEEEPAPAKAEKPSKKSK